MSKTNSLQKKTTGFDIMYRVVAAILAIAIYPAFSLVLKTKICYHNLLDIRVEG